MTTRRVGLILAATALVGCGEDGTTVELLAFTTGDAEIGDVFYTVNGERQQIPPADDSTRSVSTELRLSGEVDILVEAQNASDFENVICAINGLPETTVEFAKSAEVSTTCHLTGNIDTSEFNFSSDPVFRVVDRTDLVTTPLDTAVDADLFTVMVPAEWESTAINLRINNGTPDPGGLDLEILMRSELSYGDTPRTSVRIDRAIDRGDVELAAWNQQFLDDLEATDRSGTTDFTAPSLVTIGDFDGYAARSRGDSYIRAFAFEVGTELIMVTAVHSGGIGSNDVSLESIVENMTLN